MHLNALHKSVMRKPEGRRMNPWDERYASDEYLYGTEPNDFLVSVAERLPRGRALCVAEGEGRNAVFLAGRGFDVTAVDASAVGMRKAERLAQERGVRIETVVADAGAFMIEPEAWDVVVLIFAHFEPELRREVHRSVVQGLRTGGAVVLEAYTPEQLRYGTGGPPTEDLMMRLGALRTELRGLRFEIDREMVREVREGRQHDGTSAVVQVLGFKE